MRHSHLLTVVEWALTRLNGTARAHTLGRVSMSSVLCAADYAGRLGASDEQIDLAISTRTRLRF